MLQVEQEPRALCVYSTQWFCFHKKGWALSHLHNDGFFSFLLLFFLVSLFCDLNNLEANIPITAEYNNTSLMVSEMTPL